MEKSATVAPMSNVGRALPHSAGLTERHADTALIGLPRPCDRQRSEASGERADRASSRSPQSARRAVRPVISKILLVECEAGTTMLKREPSAFFARKRTVSALASQNGHDSSETMMRPKFSDEASSITAASEGDVPMSRSCSTWIAHASPCRETVYVGPPPFEEISERKTHRAVMATR